MYEMKTYTEVLSRKNWTPKRIEYFLGGFDIKRKNIAYPWHKKRSFFLEDIIAAEQSEKFREIVKNGFHRRGRKKKYPCTHVKAPKSKSALSIAKYDKVKPINKSLSIVTQNGMKNIIDKHGYLRLDIWYKKIQRVNNQKYLVTRVDGKMALLENFVNINSCIGWCDNITIEDKVLILTRNGQMNAYDKYGLVLGDKWQKHVEYIGKNTYFVEDNAFRFNLFGGCRYLYRIWVPDYMLPKQPWYETVRPYLARVA